MTSKNLFILIVVIAIGGFIAGRSTAPVKIHEVTTEVVKQHEQQDSDSKKHITIIETTQPDGSKRKVTEVNQETKTDTTVQTDTNIKRESTTTFSAGSIHIQGLIGGYIPFSAPIYGLSVSKQFIGPLSIGIWGLSDKTVGVSVGITF